MGENPGQVTQAESLEPLSEMLFQSGSPMV
jgi:hypothetical protein